MHYERPFLVGLVCWVLIISNSMGVYNTMKQISSPDFAKSLEIYPYSSTTAEVILFSTMAIPVVAGIFMYEQQGWARFVYIVIMIPYFFQNFIAATHPGNPSSALYIWFGRVLLYVASIVILFLPAARFYYNPPQYIDGD